MGLFGGAGGTQDLDLLPVTRGPLDARGAGGDDMAVATGTAMLIGAGIQGVTSIYGAKKADRIQREGMKQAQANLDRGRAARTEKWNEWYKGQEPVRNARRQASLSRARALGFSTSEGTMAQLPARSAANVPAETPAETPSVMARAREVPQPGGRIDIQPRGAPEGMGFMGAMVPDDSGGRVPIQTAELMTGPGVPIPAPVPLGAADAAFMDEDERLARARGTLGPQMPTTMGGLYG
jgi:hypothetical protein